MKRKKGRGSEKQRIKPGHADIRKRNKNDRKSIRPSKASEK